MFHDLPDGERECRGDVSVLRGPWGCLVNGFVKLRDGKTSVFVTLSNATGHIAAKANVVEAFPLFEFTNVQIVHSDGEVEDKKKVLEALLGQEAES